MSIRREAAIAIGSNAIRLLCANLDERLSEPLRLREETGLFLQLSQDRLLSAEAIARLLESIARLNQAAREAGAERVHLFATATLREARNTPQLEMLLKAQLPELRLLIISGEEEARLSFLGAGLPPFLGPRGLIDIGGGSTELALGDEKGPAMLISLPMGAARLLTLQAINSEKDIDSARHQVQQLLDAMLPAPKHMDGPCFLVGGTGTTLLGIKLGLAIQDPQPEQGVIQRQTVNDWLKRLAGLCPAERLRLTGMPPGRELILPTGLVILEALMQHLGLAEVTVTRRGNLDGFLARLAGDSSKGAST